jgi:chromosome partitioning protein
MRITFISSKGGTGKSSLCLILGAVLQKAGKTVSIEDMDPQGTATHFAEVFGLSLGDPGADVILTDTPGHITTTGRAGRELAQTIKDSDRILLVCEKSPVSIHGAADSAAFIREHKRRGSKAFVLFNQVRSATTIGKQDSADLGKLLHLPVLQNEIPLTAQVEMAGAEGLKAIRGPVMDRFLNLALEIIT